jgi:hypothetical protein
LPFSTDQKWTLINKGYFEIANRRSDRCASDILTAVERSLGKELPQLVLIPLVPQLMKRVDPRIVIGIGFALFAASNFLNISMTNDYAADQLLWPNVVRAVGQALAFAPLSAVATAGIEAENAESASALFNISLLKTPFIAKPNPACQVRRSRGVTPAAPHRQADRRRSRRLAGDS